MSVGLEQEQMLGLHSFSDVQSPAEMGEVAVLPSSKASIPRKDHLAPQPWHPTAEGGFLSHTTHPCSSRALSFMHVGVQVLAPRYFGPHPPGNMFILASIPLELIMSILVMETQGTEWSSAVGQQGCVLPSKLGPCGQPTDEVLGVLQSTVRFCPQKQHISRAYFPAWQSLLTNPSAPGLPREEETFHFFCQ